MKRHKMRQILVLSLMAFGVALAFQNCADPLNVSSDNQLVVSSTIPFAYDTTVDTISYMSCSNVPAAAPPRAVYTFRAGAYNNDTSANAGPAGLGLSLGAWPYFQSMLVNKRAQMLSKMPENIGTFAQLALRTSSDLQGSILTASSGSASPSTDYFNFLDSLDSGAIVQRVAGLQTQREKVSYFSGIAGLSGRLLEGSLYFGANETLASSVRQNLGNGALLTLTYTNPSASAPYSARAPAGVPKYRAYGRGFNFVFTLDLDNYTSADTRVVDRVNEIDLLTGLTSGSGIGAWDCSISDRYVIIRGEDAASGIPNWCHAQSDLDIINSGANSTIQAQLRAQLARARNVLRAEDWYVDPVHLCILPKQTQNVGSDNDGCYGNLDSGVSVNYNKRTTTGTVTTCSGNVGSTSICPHYVSICARRVAQ